MSDAISLHGMQFLASVGLLPEERTRKQPLEVDLTVWLDRPLTVSHVRQDTLDYRRLYEVAASVVNAGHIEYLEEIALAVAEGALRQPGVARARVRVRKPHVPLPGPLRAAEVEIERPTRA